jgi:hypothetical protein
MEENRDRCFLENPKILLDQTVTGDPSHRVLNLLNLLNQASTNTLDSIAVGRHMDDTQTGVQLKF